MSSLRISELEEFVAYQKEEIDNATESLRKAKEELEKEKLKPAEATIKQEPPTNEIYENLRKEMEALMCENERLSQEVKSLMILKNSGREID